MCQPRENIPDRTAAHLITGTLVGISGQSVLLFANQGSPLPLLPPTQQNREKRYGRLEEPPDIVLSHEKDNHFDH